MQIHVEPQADNKPDDGGRAVSRDPVFIRSRFTA